jgi:transposase
MWLKRGVCTRSESGVPSRLPSTDKEVLMTVIIGVDPHRQSHTAVAICGEEREVAKVTVRATRQQADKLLAWAEPFKERTWAIESAGGLGYLLAQQLVDVGEHVVDVPPTLASEFGSSALVVRRKTIRMMHSLWQSLLYALMASVGSKRPSTARSCGGWPSATTTWAGCGGPLTRGNCQGTLRI